VAGFIEGIPILALATAVMLKSPACTGLFSTRMHAESLTKAARLKPFFSPPA